MNGHLPDVAGAATTLSIALEAPRMYTGDEAIPCPSRDRLRLRRARFGIPGSLGEPDHDDESVIDRPQFIGRQVSHLITQPLNVDGAEQFDEYAVLCPPE